MMPRVIAQRLSSNLGMNRYEINWHHQDRAHD